MGKFYSFILILLVFSNYCGIANEKEGAQLEKFSSDSGKVESEFIQLKKLALGYQADSLQASIYFSRKLLELAESRNNEMVNTDAHYLLGVGYYKQNDLNAALPHLVLARTGFESSKDSLHLSKTLNYIGNIYSNLGDLRQALDVHLKALSIRKKLNNQDEISRSLNNIGNVYFVLKDYEKALSFYEQSRRIKEDIGDTVGIAIIYNNIGNILSAQEHHEKALEKYQKALEIGLNGKDRMGIVIALGNIGNVYLEQKQYDKAIVFFNRSLHESERINDLWGVANISNCLGTVYLELKEYDKAFNALSKGLAVGEETNNLLMLKETYGLFARLFEEKNNYKESLKYHKLCVQAKDSIFNEKNSRSIAEMQTLYQMERKKIELKKLQQENTIQEFQIKRQKANNIYFLSIVACVLIFTIYAIYISLFRKKHNKLLKEKNKTIYEINQKLSESNATKDKFLSVVAHDLKNPFNAVQGFTDLLLDRYDELDDQVRKEYLEIIHKSSLQGTHLLETLLQWSRSQMGVIQYSPKNFDLGQLVKDMMEELKEKARSKDIELVSTVNCSYLVYGDVYMVQTVLRNLGHNALKFTREKGRVSINLKEEDGEVVCEVTDSGIGIAEENQKKLFNLDSNFTTQGTSNEKGTGLGLILCKEFVEKNRGQIGVRSELDKGSVFWFSLPIGEPVVAQKKSSNRNPAEDLVLSS